MKNYKEHKAYLGFSDVASLTLRAPDKTAILNFGEDGEYHAWMVDDENVEIPEHYTKQFECEHWLKVYDDDACSLNVKSPKIEVYTAGQRGCLIRLLGE